jgi:type I restriction enzyme, S subunit
MAARVDEKGLVPKLRFPEFRGAGGWQEKTIGQVCKSFSGGTPNTAQKDFYGGSIPFIRSAEIDRAETELFLTEEGLTHSAAKLVTKGDVLVALYGANSGDVALARIDGAINQAILCLKSDRSNAFIHQFLSLRKNWIITTYLQGGQGNLSGEIVKSISLGFPDSAEQQKIAECLSSVDELMAAQARKVDALKTHKKGLMQQLFPREGETQPRLRFPEFQNAEEWEAATIGDLKPFVTSGSRGWASFYAEQGELFVRITNLWRDSIYLDLTDSKFVQLPPGANEGVRTQLKEHDVLISITADIGIIGYVDESVPSPAYINQHIALVRFDAGQLSGKYVAYFLASEKSQRLFRAATDTGTKAGMSLIGIQKIELMLPGLPEQQRIASFLSNLDTLITAETQKLEALKTHKKGVMQQLFPSPEAVAA